MEINNNIPNYNFITSLIREKNNNIKENILLGNIHFPEMLIYSPKTLLESENHVIFINKLSNKLSLEKIKEEKNFLNKKIEMTNNKIDNIKNYINKETVKRNYNDLLPPLNFSNILPIIKEKKEKNKKSKEKFNKNKLLMEIRPLPSKRGNQVLIDKRLNKEKEYDLEQNAKEFIRKINNYKINNINMKKQKQKLDFLRLQKEIEIAERKKQKEEYELIQKREELKQNFLKKQNLFNNYNNEMSPQKIKRKRYHYYNNPQNSSRKNRNKMMKNFSYVFHHNNNNYNYNYQFYNNINNINNNFNGGYYIYPNINPYQQYNNNDKDRRNTENNGTLNVENNGMMYKEQSNHSIANESRINNSILNTTEKKHLYYFNDLKYENEK